MIDLVDMHSHIIFGVDDGAQDEDETRKMLEIAYNHGTRTIIATPHHHPARGNESKEVIERQFNLTKKIASEISDDLNVLLGMEIYFSQDAKEELSKNKLLTLNNSNTILVEFDFEYDFNYIHSSLLQLQMLGYNVILAHIERYSCFVRKPDLVYEIFRQGIKIQINANSITGGQGKKIRKFVNELLDNKVIYCVGSDGHDQDERTPILDEAYDQVVKNQGEEYANKIFRDNILKLINK